jgi:autotransporter passenger strand-loop-strand repeat protein
MAETIASGTTVSNISLGTQQLLEVYGTVDGAIEASLAEINVYSSGVVNHDDFDGNNCIMYVYDGGSSNFGTLAVGEEDVDGGTDSGTTITTSGASPRGLELVQLGGISYDAVLTGGSTSNPGGGQDVYEGGTAYYTKVGAFCEQDIAHGLAIGTTVESAGIVRVYDNGTMSSAEVENGGLVYLSGTAVDTVLNGGTIIVNSGGISTDATITASGSIGVGGGGVVSNTKIDGGVCEVYNGGTVAGSPINGGKEYVSSGGIAKSTAINSGGTQTILAHGSATGTAIHTGTQTISSGGESLNATIYSGGKVVVSTGGLLFNSPISSGGEATILSGGTISATTIAGGTLDLAGGKDVGHINFTHTGSKLIAADAVPGNIISGFAVGDEIILGSIAYKSGATVTVKSAGVVTITNNKNTFHLDIAGATVGETDFRFSSGSIFTKIATPAMEFLRPTASAATPATEPVMVSAGGAVFSGYNMSAVIQGGFMAHEGWRPVLYGVPMSLTLHPQ